jgi:hypothetical protein
METGMIACFLNCSDSIMNVKIFRLLYTVKKFNDFPVPSRDVTD